jgi:hypothetical protein
LAQSHPRTVITPVSVLARQQYVNETNQFNFRIATKCELIIVVDIGKLLLGHAYSAFRHVIDLALLQNFVEHIDFIVKSRGTDLAGFIKEMNCEKLPFTL